MAEHFAIRLATPADAGLIARHRARMFQDTGEMPAHLFEKFLARCKARTRAMLEEGEYIGWLASPSDEPGRVIAGAGVQIRQVLPHPVGDPEKGFTIAEGRQAIIINVFTEPAWRRRGAAKLLLEEIIAWARERELESLVLHASEEGRALYEQLDFKASREMRLNWRRLRPA